MNASSISDDDPESRKILMASTKKDTEVTPLREIKLLLDLAIPTVVIQLGLTVPAFLTASHVGRTFGSVHLDGFTLANLTGNLFTLALLSGIGSASNTLSPQAFGTQNYRQLGLIAIRTFVGSMSLVIPINILVVMFMEKLLLQFGQDQEASRHASDFYMIYVFSLPFYSIFLTSCSFLTAQATMWPLMVATLVSCAVVLPLSLELFIRIWGFHGAAMAIVLNQATQAFLVLLLVWWKQPHHPETWPFFRNQVTFRQGCAEAWREAIIWKQFKEFMILGMGGMLASLEWIYWEFLALLCGTLGVVPLSIHTIPTQVVTVTFMAPYGVGSALGVRVGATLPNNVSRAKQLAVWTFLINAVLFGLLSIVMYQQQDAILSMFTTETDVLVGTQKIWGKVCFYNAVLAVFGTVMGVATGLGMQWTLGVVTIFFLWGFGLPATYLDACLHGGGVGAIWSWLSPPYIGINVLMIIAFLRKNWDALANEIRIREAVSSAEVESLLLQSNENDYGSTSHTNQ